MAIDGSRSNFPTTIDTLLEYKDLSPSELNSAARWQTLKLRNRTSAEETEFNNLTILLSGKIFTPESLNTLADCIFNLEVFFHENVQDFILGKQTEFNSYVDTKQSEFDAVLANFSDKGNWDNTVTYKQWNTVQYNYEAYLSKVDGNINHIPVGDINDNYWQKIAQRGQQGIPGIGLSFLGEYNNAYDYVVGNAVRFNEKIYYCINPCTGILPTNISYWQLFIDASGAIVSNTSPNNPYTGMVWIDTN